MFNKIKDVFFLLRDIRNRLQKIQQSLGRIESRQMSLHSLSKFNENEFQVFSQWGEDGLIQFLINNVEIERPIFVEFGVETYQESNTRFLLVNNNWSGLVIDGSESNIMAIKKDPIYWKHNIKADCAFINKENINELIKRNGITGDIGLLSVDIDGNDYWVWEAIDVISPRIVVCEYNSMYGTEEAVTVPYDPNFIRNHAHFSNLYWGASVSAFTMLANSKGYALVGGNKAGNNLFFVRRDVIGKVKEVQPHEAHRHSMFRESKDRSGNLTYLSYEERLSVIKDMPLIDLADKKNKTVKAIYGI